MRLARLLFLAAPLAAGCAVPRPFGEGVGLQTLLEGGYRSLRDDVYEGHPVYGLELATSEADSGWGYEVGGHYATEDAGGSREREGEFSEVHAGLRRTFGPARDVRPYLGFGGAYARVRSSLHSPTLRFDDRGGAFYAHGGVLWRVGRFAFDLDSDVLLGFDVRGVVGEEYDSAQAALVLGFGR